MSRRVPSLLSLQEIWKVGWLWFGGRGPAWRRLAATLGLVAATAFAGEAWAQGQLSRSLERLASEITDLFPKVEGDVIKVQGNEVFIALGAPDNVREGMELSLFRKGEEFKHPLTGVVLGRFEEDLGTLVIRQVAEGYSRGTVRLAKPNVSIRPGDRARITKGKIALAILPLKGDLPEWLSREEVLERFRSALERTGRFQVTAADNVRVYLVEKGVNPDEALSPDVLSRLAEDLRVTYGIAPQTRQVGNESVLEVGLIGLAHQRTVFTSSAILAEPEAVARAPEPGGRPQVRPGLFREARKPPPGYRLDLSTLDLGKTMKELIALPFLVTSMDVCGVVAEGSEDIVVTDGKKVLVYQLNGEQVEFIDEYVPGVASTLMTVQCAEIDKNPGQEIIVNQYINNALDGAILSYRNGRLQVLQDHIEVLLAALDTDGDGVNETVWGQPYDLRDFFTVGRATLYAYEGGRLRRQERVEVPKVFRATGVAMAELSGDGRHDLVLIDESRQLRVYRGQQELYRSSDRVGGGYSVVEVWRETTGRVNRPFPYFLEPWMAVADLNGDGRQDVVVPRNTRSIGNVLANVNLYAGGDVVVLSQQEFGYSLTAITPQFDGVVSGVAILRQRSYPAFIIAVSQGTFLGGGNSLLLLSRRPQ
ncbi:MAG TPA: VCBS repeat-containing protein [Alphaproteobacteria bacterium]|nr:VCBS repeat-containing protein [Alphaproteobacteria bacterium]